MNNKGYVLLHKRMINWEWYTDLKTSHLFIHCLLKANFCDNRHKGTMIKRGSFVISYKQLSNETGLSIQSIRTSLKKIEATQEITRISTCGGTHITICKYDSYQSSNSKTNTDTNTETNFQSTQDQQLISNKKEFKRSNIIYNNNKPGYDQIINYLNEKALSNFKPGFTKALYQILIDNGFLHEDFIIVIDKMTDAWIGTKYVNGLRPQTLFRDPIKFEEYLNWRSFNKNPDNEETIEDDEQYL